MDVTKPCKSVGFGAAHVPRPYEFVGFVRRLFQTPVWQHQGQGIPSFRSLGMVPAMHRGTRVYRAQGYREFGYIRYPGLEVLMDSLSE